MHLKYIFDVVESHHGEFKLVFKGPVRSGLSTPRAVDRDQDRSTSVQRPQKTGLDRKFIAQLIYYIFYIYLSVGIVD